MHDVQSIRGFHPQIRHQYVELLLTQSIERLPALGEGFNRNAIFFEVILQPLADYLFIVQDHDFDRIAHFNLPVVCTNALVSRNSFDEVPRRSLYIIVAASLSATPEERLHFGRGI
jgi:hypothetical protein